MTAPKNHEQENKPQPSLIPLDLLIKILEPAYREGLIKYSRESWRKGFHTTIMMDATQRHLSAHFYDGEDFDPDAKKLGIDKTHLGGALFSILCMAHAMLYHSELDNRPGKMREGIAEKIDVTTLNTTGKKEHIYLTGTEVFPVEDEKRKSFNLSDPAYWPGENYNPRKDPEDNV